MDDPALMDLDAVPQDVSVHELQVDSASSDCTESIRGSGPQSSTTSVRSSVYHYIEEHGRRYHAYKQGNYLLPNDDAEQERLELQHSLWLMTLENKLYTAPISNMRTALDMATGTGSWAIELALEMPGASILGVDLSPIQPQYVPPNCNFEVGDVEEDWQYTHKFDYIHGRAMVTCFNQPKNVFLNAYEALNPGGYLEVQDMIFPFKGIDHTWEGSAIQKWCSNVIEGASKLGRDWTKTANYRQWMEEVGFVDIVEKRYQWPIGTWPKGKHQKTLGLWVQQDILDAVEGASMTIFTKGLKWTPEQVQEDLVKVRQDVRNRGIHSYIEILVIYGRKPQ